MSIRVNRRELRYALCSGPTRHWSATLHRAEHIIEGGAICTTDEVMLVEDNAWHAAMQELRNLPYGGRHVWKARADLWRGIEKATNQGESK
jgi:hypothetical protein